LAVDALGVGRIHPLIRKEPATIAADGSRRGSWGDGDTCSPTC
jgi:hypothetical protein